MTEQMTEEAVDGPVSFCDPAVIAIFPVRYALTEAKLNQIAGGATSVAVPQNKDSLTDHELRRIRAGYVYSYGDNDTWRVFRYLADEQNDENSSLDFNDSERVPGAKLKFYELNWSNGAGGTWRKKSQPLSYLTVSSTVSKIWIAYSEERWPPHMLELLEVNPSLRAKVMQEVNLKPEDTPHSFRLDQLSQKVVEFKGTSPSRPAANQMRYTQLHNENASGLEPLCERNRETARVVALRDDLGEILDIGAIHIQLAHAIQRFTQEHYYATSMADCVDLIRKDVDETYEKWYKILSTHPLNPQFASLRAEIGNEIRAQEARSKGIIELIASIYARSGNFSPATEIEVATNGVTTIDTMKQAEVWEYCWFLLGRSWQFTAITVAGNKLMGEVFSGTATSKAKDWFKTVRSLLSASTKGKHAFEVSTLRHFNFAVSSQAYVMAQVATRSPAGLWYQAEIMKPMGGTVRMTTVRPDEVAGLVRRQFAQSGLISVTAQVDEATGHFNSPRTSLLNVPVLEGGISAGMTASGSSSFQRLHNADSVLKGVGLFSGLVTGYAALQNLARQQASQRNATGAGAVASNAITAVVAEIVGVAASINDVRKLTRTADFGRIGTDGLKSLFADGRRFNSASIRVINSTASNGIGANIVKFATLSNAALMVSAAIAMGKSYEGFVRGDMNMAIGNALLAAGSIILLVAGGTGVGAVVGLVVIAVGVVINIFADSDVEAWLRGSFWGSGYYTYWDQRRDVFEDQLSDSKLLADNNAEKSRQYKEELEAFLDLIWGLSISNASKGDKIVEIYCSAIKSPADLARLSVTISRESTTVGRGGAASTSTTLDDVTVDIDFVAPERVIARFANFRPKDDVLGTGYLTMSRIEIKATYPKFAGGQWEDKLKVTDREL